ncbi:MULTISPECIES: acyl-CoA dehydrogenase family protein [unclassified Acidovorax]|uniref:acyl-CoA dehydrogenase family protein n=2 Tax=Acidovorax TaxID=12916 RepID=UPI000BD7BC3F|nr:MULTISPECIES: acyl-CoA dehydrogenase family protein [unclassified Acidovorax]OZA57993.1 MAG: acyl-CoA dehydrogenase [Acidovorax sp. 17-64-282]HQS21271.1 acyl-CoA dehydrogenase family protein [Acidovorax defluvii]OYY28266.1 MAG: acyl-CoA dehydrogenase [Acidovorax sp. 35-64-16]OYY86101.1 MAG: acyl-CoA dehydrogenase [Acidovorax sp. 28-64-14]OYZ45741.1 MAG: acyl-CoA dehydrogenase [Acidovorax sp. 16-64-162]
MDFELTEEQRAFAQTARDFALAELAPHAAHWDAEGIFPKEAIAKAGELGFCGLYAPEAAGGLALPRLDATLVFEEMAAVDPSTTAFITIHNMATWMLGTWAQPEVRDHWGPLLTTGEKLASYCLTEPGAGSDAASLKTRAELVGNEYVINGSKAFISGAGATDVLVLMARTGDAQSGAAGISAFAVPANLPGIHYGKKEEKMGWNSQPTRTISFDNVRIPADHLLGREGEGFKIAMKGLDGGRINIATCSVGAAQGALNAAQQYMHDRKQFGKSIASFQALQFKLADMATELVAARQMVRLAASKLDAGARDASTYCAMAKRFATDAGFNVVNEALQLHGGYGYIREYPLERLMRDARVHQILEGTNEIMRVIIARRMLEGDAPDAIR